MRGFGLLAPLAYLDQRMPEVVPHELFLPKTLPAGWSREGKIIHTATEQGAFYRSKDGLVVAVSAKREEDDKRWLHVSCSRKARMPSYEDLTVVKRVFVGPERFAYQVFAPASEHYSLHPFCLHLWACLDAGERGAVLPDFLRFADGGDL
jgi:hypothetical protein